MSSEVATATTQGHTHRDDAGTKLGMWLFLFTELILFGGLFIIYAVYRFSHGAEFELAANELDRLVGTVNTIILLTSSLTVAMSITAIQEGKKNLTLLLVGMTVVLAFAFLLNKYFEWDHKIVAGIYPGSPDLINKPLHILGIVLPVAIEADDDVAARCPADDRARLAGSDPGGADQGARRSGRRAPSGSKRCPRRPRARTRRREPGPACVPTS